MKGDTFPSITCEKLVWGGKGFARLSSGLVVLVEGILPGELAQIQITKEHKDYLEARVVRILEPSVDRVLLRCRHFSVCGGCDWQYFSYAGQLKAKEEIFREVMSRGADLQLSTKAEPSGKQWGYRSRAQWHWSGAHWEVYPKGGFSSEPMQECPISDPLLEAYLVKGEKPKREGRYHLATREGKVLKDWQGESVGSLEIKGKEIFFSVKGFFQNNRTLLEPWIDFVTKNLSGGILWDLYAGTGILSAFLTDKFIDIYVVETSSASLSLASQNVGLRARLLKKDVLDFLKAQKKSAGSVIINPPRMGLDKEVVKELKRLSPENLIYVSCNPTTLARDMRQLKEVFQVQESRIFDFYPQTYHMEAVLRLKRKERL